MQQYSETSDQFTYDKMENIEKKFTILSHRVQSVYNERAFYSFATDARYTLFIVYLILIKHSIFIFSLFHE